MNKPNIYSPPDADLNGASEESKSLEIDENLAGRWARLGAYIIDSIILILPFVAIFVLTDSWEGAANRDYSVSEQLIYFLIGIAQYLLVNGYLLHRRGQTVGKWVLGIRIVSFNTNKILPLWKVFLVRYVPPAIVAMLPLVGVFLAIINDLFIFRKDKRCIHDHLAGTKVIKEYAH
jgi:uncharacterized RDD family membrane protein YckC